MDKNDECPTLSNVISVGDFSVLKKERKYGDKPCLHRTITLDDNGQIVTCCDCGQQIDAYWALNEFSKLWKKLTEQLKSREEYLRKEKEAILYRIAAKKVDKVWRTKNLVPTCPHCGEGISPEDGFGNAAINKRVDEARRKAREENKK